MKKHIILFSFIFSFFPIMCAESQGSYAQVEALVKAKSIKCSVEKLRQYSQEWENQEEYFKRLVSGQAARPEEMKELPQDANPILMCNVTGMRRATEQKNDESSSLAVTVLHCPAAGGFEHVASADVTAECDLTKTVLAYQSPRLNQNK